DAGVGDRPRRDLAGRLPDLHRVVLDPAGPGEVLLELRVGAARDAALAIEDEARRAARALVDCEDHRRPQATFGSTTPARSPRAGGRDGRSPGSSGRWRGARGRARTRGR